ncbi:imidazolonepropionase-like amidohydrolase [Jejuia pallidilutea]|uniref:Imidazolonepropionase-like amidohydrolase n=1 Tax=Jejuia pallidilutea TaxID=504487 RepID=A0A362X3H5_9FLAO|nr:amidohydrolase family protein [Jejuia pallidilutea]PQV51438.1 imidazolonepropionase-like amidohydrolase [Jejuia pallidilutea]
MKNAMKHAILGLLLLAVSFNSFGQDKEKTSYVLITNATVFDGVNEKLMEDTDILIENNLIKDIGKNLKAPKGAEVIDVTGKTLLPGFIDAHTHLALHSEVDYLIYSAPEGYMGAKAATNATQMLMRGFTTVRDIGGPTIGLKMAIDEGAVIGPRILPAGKMISQSAGHGDFNARQINWSQYFAGQIDPAYIRGWTTIADGIAEVQKATRETLRSGASQIKIMGSGSILGAHDPLDVTEYTIEELKAIVKEADKWGTYCGIHAYTSESVMNAINAGVQSIEHGLFASEEAFKLMKEKDVFFSTQFMAFSSTPEEAGMNEVAAPKYLLAKEGADNGYRLSKKVGVKMAFGTDLVGGLDMNTYQPQEFVARLKYYTPYEILVQATSLNAELLERSGKRHPYQEGSLGVVKEGAYADIVVVDGNPLKDLTLLVEPDKNIKLIMKDGKVYKNTLN